MNVRETLKELGVKTVKGQNFLVSETAVKALVEAGEVDDGTVLEIGAGTGSITRSLAERAEKVYAVERDTTLADYLASELPTNVEVVNEDFLEYRIPEDIDRCVSNIPFQISSEVIEKLGERQVQSALILQKDLVDKAVAEPGSSDYGLFTVKVNYYFIPVRLREITSSSYYPEPEVDTSMIKLYPNMERHGVKDEGWFFEVANALFTHKRKKVRNAFVDARHIFGIKKQDARDMRDELPHSEERVNQLEVIHFREVAEFLERELDVEEN